MSSQDYSIVEYFSWQERYKCGYCGSLSKSCSNKKSLKTGMWAHTMTVQDYQNLIDRGWRRSGCYCYKPTMNETCCPSYTIKCEGLNFVLTKSQRKVLKKMKMFLNKKLKKEDLKKNRPTDVRESESSVIPDRLLDKKMLSSLSHKLEIDQNGDSIMHEENCKTDSEMETIKDKFDIPSTSISEVIDNKVSEKAKIKPTPEQCSGFIKGKILRRERKRKKMLAQGKTVEEINAAFEEHRQKNRPKTLENYMEEIYSVGDRLKNKIVRVLSEEFLETLDATSELYKKYQQAIHLSDTKDCDKKTFINFLVKSPLQSWNTKNSPPDGYGSFHDQYWLDGKLIAIAVLDILPACISSVYFFYDPEYSSLSLGTFSSLREVYLMRQFNGVAPELKYYYMGFYIHSCPKMRYKAKMRPSKLLCPETYTWCDIDKCLPKLDVNKYSRFNEDIDAVDTNGFVDIEQVLVLYKERAMPYRIYRTRISENDEEEVKEYASLVGSPSARNMLLYRECTT